MRPVLLLPMLALALLAGTGTAHASDPAFYLPPAPLPAGGDGALIRSEPLTGPAAIPGAARNVRVLYRSTGVSGAAIAVSGTIAIPRGRAPRGGWPVLSWAHGTTGLADFCAPSRDESPLHAGDYAYGRAAHAIVRAFLRRGFVVAQTDYEGLGTPGQHPYLIGASEARGVIDIVRAARALDHRVGRTWVAAGHSQGGQAALFAAALARRRAPELRLAGVDALAAASSVSGFVHFLPQFRRPVRTAGLLPYILAGAQTVSADVRPLDLLTPAAAAFYPLVESACVEELLAPASFAGLLPTTMMVPGASTAALQKVLRANDPRDLRIRVPVFLQQGEADGLVPLYTSFGALYGRLVNHGARVAFRTYPKVDHVAIVSAGSPAAVAWAAARAGLSPRRPA